MPPNRPALWSTPWLCAYWPVRLVARLGQQSGKLAIACVKFVPSPGQQGAYLGHGRERGGRLVVGHHHHDVGTGVLRGRGAGGQGKPGQREQREGGGESTHLFSNTRWAGRLRTG